MAQPINSSILDTILSGLGSIQASGFSGATPGAIDAALNFDATNFGKGLVSGSAGMPSDIASIVLAGMSEVGEQQGRNLIGDPMGLSSNVDAGSFIGDLPGGSQAIGKGLGADLSSLAFMLGDIGAPDPKDLLLAGSKLLSSGALLPIIAGMGKLDVVGDAPKVADELLGNFPSTTAGRIRNRTESDGGITVNLQTGQEPVEGLMVGKFANTDPRNKVLTGKIQNADLQDFVKTNKKSLNSIDNYLGTWKEGATGKIYLDVARRFEPTEIRKATKFGERTKQLAGFNVGTRGEFPIGNWDEYIKSPAFAERMEAMREVGQTYLKAHPTKEWWDINATLFEEVYGKENLEVLAGFIASTAPNTNPTQNLRMASEYMRRHLLGEDIMQPGWRVPAGTQTRTEGVQIGMEAGRKRNLTAASEGRISDLRQDKVRSEAQALLGDPDAAVFDRWWARLSEDAEKGVFTATGEGTFESARKTYNQYDELHKVVRAAAEAQGRTVRDYSADVWTGVRQTVKETDQLFGKKFKGSALTGESKGYADLFSDLIKSKAEFLGISVEKFKSRLASGDAELLTLVIGAPLGAHVFSQLDGVGSEIAPTPDDRMLAGFL